MNYNMLGGQGRMNNMDENLMDMFDMDMGMSRSVNANRNNNNSNNNNNNSTMTPPVPSTPSIPAIPIFPSEEGMKFQLAMSYVPWQKFQNIYTSTAALHRGTIFKDLDFPFLRGEMNPRG